MPASEYVALPYACAALTPAARGSEKWTEGEKRVDSFLCALSEHQRAYFENMYVTGVQMCNHVTFISTSFNDGESITEVTTIIIVVTENKYDSRKKSGWKPKLELQEGTLQN
jgi:hypothetical protein